MIRHSIWMSLLLVYGVVHTGCESSSSGGGSGDVVDSSRVTEVQLCLEDVMSWPVTQSSVQAVVSGEHIVFEGYDPNKWTPGFGAKKVNANSFVGYERADGTIIMSTWEYVPMGLSHRGADFGRFLRPASGQTVYFMIAGLCRDAEQRNVSERSNISKIVWP